jgi:hypothetical protein
VSDEGARSLFRDDPISWLLVMKYLMLQSLDEWCAGGVPEAQDSTGAETGGCSF